MAGIFSRDKPIQFDWPDPPQFKGDDVIRGPLIVPPSASSTPAVPSPQGFSIPGTGGLFTTAGYEYGNLTSIIERRNVSTHKNIAQTRQMSSERHAEVEKPMSDNDPNVGTCMGPPRVIRRYTRAEWNTRATAITDDTPIP